MLTFTKASISQNENPEETFKELKNIPFLLLLFVSFLVQTHSFYFVPFANPIQIGSIPPQYLRRNKAGFIFEIFF